MKSTIFTIGYEAATISGLLSALTKVEIEVLADVRAIAHSRRRGLAKTALNAHLASTGIAYWHLPDLGNPKAGREAAWSGNDAMFRSIFTTHLGTAAAIDSLAHLATRARQHRICLLCLETDPAQCHRAMVADALRSEHGFKVRHLVPAHVYDYPG